jgi:putative nucleotidyltransferase with HDIG domain
MSTDASVWVARDITERKLSETRIQAQIDRLSALRVIDQAISSSFDLRVTLSILLNQVMSQLRADAAAVLLYNPQMQTLQYSSGSGFRTKSVERTRLHLGDSYAGRAVLERQMISASPSAAHDLRFTALKSAEGFATYFCLPLITKGNVVGVLEIFHRAPFEPDSEWISFLEMLAGQAAIAIDNANLFQNLQRSNIDLMLAYDTTLEGWSRALDLRDKETEGHSQRVTAITLQMARAMELGEETITHIRRGALLHDIGKMGVPDSILLKPDKLTDDEWDSMRRHPQLAVDLLSPIPYLRPALDIPYCHHEKWDGTGYPRGLKGEQIPLAARIFAIADVWDALRSDRPYRPGWSALKTREHIKSLSGTHLDPRVVEVFLQLPLQP